MSLLIKSILRLVVLLALLFCMYQVYIAINPPINKHKIYGRVIDGSGKPVSGVVVKAFDADIPDRDDFMGQARTDKNGYYEIRYPDITWDIHVIGGLRSSPPDIYLRVNSPISRNTFVKGSASMRNNQNTNEDVKMDVTVGHYGYVIGRIEVETAERADRQSKSKKISHKQSYKEYYIRLYTRDKAGKLFEIGGGSVDKNGPFKKIYQISDEAQLKFWYGNGKIIVKVVELEYDNNYKKVSRVHQQVITNFDVSKPLRLDLKVKFHKVQQKRIKNESVQ